MSPSAAACRPVRDEAARERCDGEPLYFEACLPCSISEGHVLGPDARGLYRVVTGIFDRLSTARRSLAKPHGRWKLEAFVREL